MVRDLNRGRAVRALEYEAYEEMALAVMREIVAETKSRFPVTAVRLVHRLGRLAVGDPSVAVAVASPHRAEAFAACRFAIDTLKARVPIWKKEFYADGSEWLDAPAAATLAPERLAGLSRRSGTSTAPGSRRPRRGGGRWA